jgi:pilus assembly protein CpaB
MLFRNVLLALGLVCLVAGAVLSVVWLDQIRRSTVEEKAPEAAKPAILVAPHWIPAGTLFGQGDLVWKEVLPGEIRAGSLVRGRVSEAEYYGAIARRDFDANEPLIAGDLVKAGDRQFLAAVLRPGTRAVSVAVDASQSASGLALPGDYVDVILTQSFNEAIADPGRRSVGETVLRNVRVIAVDQSLITATKSGATDRGVFVTESRIPKTVTLELDERQAELMLVASQLGRLNLSVRSLERPGPGDIGKLGTSVRTWASDVSPALGQLARRQTGSTVESAIRWAPVASP